ncbi:uncharacterized protein METZ01_LOCUS76043 [marine metagenome]|uniref:Uncharacterized protein n=1 Tax=marine metagenome TaxID=408172 RepID=A0A381U4Z6_9ZZZZ
MGMITVNCHDVEPILHELMIYVADQVAAVPFIKFHKFILTPIMDDESVNSDDVISSIKEFLDSIGEKHNYGVILNGDTITIKSIHGKQIEREKQPQSQLFSCAHCGHVTQYEVEHNNHVKIHYL